MYQSSELRRRFIVEIKKKPFCSVMKIKKAILQQHFYQLPVGGGKLLLKSNFSYNSIVILIKTNFNSTF